jgi:peroxiredoxin
MAGAADDGPPPAPAGALALPPEDVELRAELLRRLAEAAIVVPGRWRAELADPLARPRGSGSPGRGAGPTVGPIDGFELSNAAGSAVRLSGLLARRRPLALLFYRGGWVDADCLALRAAELLQPALDETGAGLVGISPEVPNELMRTAARLGTSFDLLSDMSGMVARRLGVLRRFGGGVAWAMRRLGIDLVAANGTGLRELPLPVTLLVEPGPSLVAAGLRRSDADRLGLPGALARAPGGDR